MQVHLIIDSQRLAIKQPNLIVCIGYKVQNNPVNTDLVGLLQELNNFIAHFFIDRQRVSFYVMDLK